MRIDTARARTMWTAIACFCLLAFAGSVFADETQDRLDRAIQLFEQGQYTAAQEILVKLEVSTLSEEQRGVRDEYVERTRVAITMVEKAELDFERADQALEHEDFPAAQAALKDVLDNEYATAAQRSDARERLNDIEVVSAGTKGPEAGQPVEPAPVQPSPPPTEDVSGQSPPPPPPADEVPADQAPPSDAAAPAEDVSRREVNVERARSLIDEGYRMLESGRTAEAERLFQSALQAVPGHPDATLGLQEAQRHSSVEVGSQSLLERMVRQRQISWERTVFQYREVEKEIKNAVLDKRFDLARQGLLRARQVLEAGAQYADPRVRYESLISELDALQQYVEGEQRRDEESNVRAQRETILLKERERQLQVAETRNRQVNALMDQALQLKKDRDFKGAVAVLNQVLAIDPRNNRARWLKDDLQDLYEITRQYAATTEKRRQQQAILVDAEEAKIPWHELLKYPDNWLEITAGSERVATGRERLSPEDRQLHAKLEQNVSMDIEDVALEEVIDDIAAKQGINITVIWNDLEAVGVERDVPVTLRFASEVKLKKAVSEILEQVGGGEVKLGYVINDGVIKIASQTLLDEEVYHDVYPIEDLLLSVPDFEGPEVSITDEGGQGGGGGGGGGGGFGGGGGGGGVGGGAGGGAGGFGGGGGGFGGGGGNQNPFTGGNEGGEDEEDDDREARVDELLELIRNTIAPDSWRDSGGTVANIDEINGQLVVTQTARAHSEIQDLLSKLREQRAIQIAIEARFITITSNYLEELGIDLDVILNQGNAGFDRAGRQYNGAQVLIPRSFSRLGFLPGTPAVGNPLQPASATVGSQPGQPFGEVGLMPVAGNGLVQGSRMTPIPVVSNVIDLVQPTSTVVPNSFGGTTIPSMQVFGSFLDGIQVDFLLRATQADRRSSIMNAPRLVLFNGQRAWVGVLNTASYVQGVIPRVDENAVAQQPSIGQLQTGTVLDVQAVVSADKRYVTMNLRPGVRQPTGPLDVFPFSGGASGAAAAADAFIQLPNTQSQVIRTTVSVPDGGTLLIGGMKTTQEIETEAGVPVLSKIPVLKRLYSARNLVKDEQVLLILVKPSIIIQREQEEAAFPTFGQR